MLMDDEITPFDKRMALSNGYIGCTECGHDIEKAHELPDGCHICMCPEVFTDEQIVALMKAYEFPPYRLGLRVQFRHDSIDPGVVVAIGHRDESVDVRWDHDGETSLVRNPRRDLVMISLT